jgi:hypothetical protein
MPGFLMVLEFLVPAEIHYLKTRLVLYSDVHCKVFVTMSTIFSILEAILGPNIVD